MAVTVGQRVPDELYATEVLDVHAAARTLAELVGGGPALLVFLRHFGCIGCTQQVGGLSPRLLELHELGVITVLIGNGDAGHIEGFVERHNLADKKATIVTDPTLNVYKLAEMRRTFWGAWGLRSMYDAARARGRGYQGSDREGDLYQQGGALLIDAHRNLVTYHSGKSIGDGVDASDVVEAAMKLLVQNQLKRGLV